MKLVLTGLLVLGLVSTADAGRFCRYRTYQTISSNYGWSHSCYSCHKQKQQKGWRESLADIAARKADNEAFYQSLSAVLGVPEQQAQGYGANVTYNGSYTSSPYPISGASAYGVQGYAGNPWANTQTLYQQAFMLAQQQNAGAAQATDAHGKLVANEALIQAQATNFNTLAQALTAAMMGPQPVPKLESLQFQVTTDATGKPVLQAAMPQQSHNFQDAMSALGPIVQQKCVACHSGETPAGKLDMTGQLTKLQLQTMSDAVDAGTMPRAPDGNPGERLSHEERDLFDNAAKLSP